MNNRGHSRHGCIHGQHWGKHKNQDTTAHRRFRKDAEREIEEQLGPELESTGQRKQEVRGADEQLAALTSCSNDKCQR